MLHEEILTIPTYFSYTAEITPAQVRGRVVATLNAGIALGILVAYWVQYGFLDVSGNAAWRSCFSLQLVPGVVVAVIMFWRAESPRWLVQHDRQEEALQVLADLHAHGDTTNNMVRSEFEEIRVVVNLEKTSATPSYFSLVFGRELRRRSGLAMGLQCMQQLSGANIVVGNSQLLMSKLLTDRSFSCTTLRRSLHKLAAQDPRHHFWLMASAQLCCSAQQPHSRL